MIAPMIFSWLARLFGWRKKTAHGARIAWPTRDEIERLPPFDALDLNRIVLSETPDAANRALAEIGAAGVVGFDTESKPTFVKGEKSTGPHVVQFATGARAYVFPLHLKENRTVVRALVSDEKLKKVGFGLHDDLRRILAKLHVHPKSVVDLETVFTARGYVKGVGVKTAVAIALRKKFSKSKKASTSNWMNRRLNERQILYAANDAYAAIKVYHAMETHKPKSR